MKSKEDGKNEDGSDQERKYQCFHHRHSDTYRVKNFFSN